MANRPTRGPSCGKERKGVGSGLWGLGSLVGPGVVWRGVAWCGVVWGGVGLGGPYLRIKGAGRVARSGCHRMPSVIDCTSSDKEHRATGEGPKWNAPNRGSKINHRISKLWI